MVQTVNVPVRTFALHLAAGALPFLDELNPRIGRIARYRADLIDRYLAGQWGQPQLVFGRRRKA